MARRRKSVMGATALRAATAVAMSTTPVLAEVDGVFRPVVGYRLTGKPKGDPSADPPEPPTDQLLILEVGPPLG
jgi:hypothetical protein